MGMKENIKDVCNLAKEICPDAFQIGEVEEWLESPSCPLIDEEELDEDD